VSNSWSIGFVVSGLVRWHCDRGTIPDPGDVRDRGGSPNRGGSGNRRDAHDREDPLDRGGTRAAHVVSVCVVLLH
jgi:hypothetical protein